jgi:hypothetical protein
VVSIRLETVHNQHREVTLRKAVLHLPFGGPDRVQFLW